MNLAQTAAAAVVQVGANTAQSVLSVYWTQDPIPLFGLFVFMLFWLWVAFLAVSGVAAWWYRDWSFFLVADTAAERSALRRLPSGQLTQFQLMLIMAAVNASAALTGWYSTPPSRTPPLIQSISNSLPVVTAIPLSVWVLGDRKRYLTPVPVLAVLLVLVGIVVSLIPAAASGASGLGDWGSVAWSGVCLLAQALSGAAYVAQQLFLVRAGMLQAGATRKNRLKAMLRMMMFNQVLVFLVAVAFFWIDILPVRLPARRQDPITAALRTAALAFLAALPASGAVVRHERQPLFVYQRRPVQL